MLTESQAWEKIAIAFYKMPSKRNNLEIRMTNDGICLAKIILHFRGDIGDKMELQIQSIIQRDVKGYTHGISTWFVRTHNRNDDILRADWCMLQKSIVDSGGI